MPVDRLAMRQIKDILRLRHDAGLSLRQIAHSLNLSVGVVGKYLQLAATAGIGWPPPADLDDGALERKLQPPAAAIRSQSPSPDFTQIHQELRRKGVTIQLLWEEYAQAHPVDHYSYPHFCVLYHQWRGRLSPTMRQTHRPAVGGRALREENQGRRSGSGVVAGDGAAPAAKRRSAEIGTDPFAALLSAGDRGSPKQSTFGELYGIPTPETGSQD